MGEITRAVAAAPRKFWYPAGSRCHFRKLRQDLSFEAGGLLSLPKLHLGNTLDEDEFGKTDSICASSSCHFLPWKPWD